MFIDCTKCHHGRIEEAGFDGRTARECPDCHGLGEIELTREEEAVVRDFLAACAASVEACETVADVERHINTPSLVPVPVHPHMTFAFFDAAVKRAFDAGLGISGTGIPGTVAVSSGTDDDTYYRVTVDACECIGGQKLNRCYHRAFYCWLLWVESCDRLAAAVRMPEPIAA
jgi:hypothetical protein